jgi:hypothetical protein
MSNAGTSLHRVPLLRRATCSFLAGSRAQTSLTATPQATDRHGGMRSGSEVAVGLDPIAIGPKSGTATAATSFVPRLGSNARPVHPNFARARRLPSAVCSV